MLTGATAGHRKAVLLVDGDPDTREMYAEYLRYEGLRPVMVATGQHALRLASHVDAIVTELLLPGRVDGFTLIQQLKNELDTRNTPLIVVTACAWSTERARAVQAGCDLFLSKPCLPDDLAREVRRLLAAATSARDGIGISSRAPVSDKITSAESFPQDGDIVVTRDGDSLVHFTVRQLPGIVQFSAALREQAVNLARGFGRRYDVDVWYSEAGRYRLLESYRPTSARTRQSGSPRGRIGRTG